LRQTLVTDENYAIFSAAAVGNAAGVAVRRLAAMNRDGIREFSVTADGKR